MSRFQQVAAAITKRHGVHVEWSPANREYVVEGRPASTARKADQLARTVAHAANMYGMPKSWAGPFDRIDGDRMIAGQRLTKALG